MPLNRREFLIGSAVSSVLLPLQLNAAEAVLRLAYFDTYAPYSVRDPETDQMSGLLVDANTLIAAEAGFQTYHKGFPWARAQLMVQQGKLDAVCTNPTGHRRTYLLFCETPLIESRIGVFHRKSDPRFETVVDRSVAKEFRYGDFIGNDWARQNLSDFHIEWSQTEENVFRKVAYGRLDGFISQEVTAYNKLERLGLTDLFAFTPTPYLGGFHFTFGLRKDFPDAAQVINKINRATQKLHANGQLQAVFDRYFT